MSNILHITSSNRSGSVSNKVAEFVIEGLQEKQDIANVARRDVTNGIGFIDDAWITARVTPTEDLTTGQKEILAQSDALIDELKQADSIVISTAMHNFTIPAALKAWADLVARPGVTFAYSSEGPEGLLKDKKAWIVLASGGVPAGSQMDFATTYLKAFLGFIGITDVTVVESQAFGNGDRDQLDVAKDNVAESLKAA